MNMTNQAKPRVAYTAEAWEAAEWAIPLHTQPLGVETWAYLRPTPDQVRGYIAQTVFKYQKPLREELATLQAEMDDAVRLLEVLEKENAELQAMLEKCNSKFIVGLEAENAALREEIRELNQITAAATTEECAEPVAVVYVADPIPDGTHGRWMSWLVNPVNLANNTKLYASAPDLEAKVAAAKLEIEQLRWYGNKDCTHQADEELRRLGYPL